MANDDESVEQMKQELEKELSAILQDGFLSDVVEVQQEALDVPEAVDPWSHLPFKLYKSATATKVLKTQLDAIVPGTSASYNQVIAAVMEQSDTVSFCYLVGGHVRDILRGKVGHDIDFNYACTAQNVAMVCVKNMWPVKFKAIGPTPQPNYVLVGDESTDTYMEGFSLTFNAVAECFKGDFRQNILFYDCTNHAIIDKSGYGIEDIRCGQLRMACAPFQNFEDWAATDITYGLKALRYVKFLMRSKQEGKMSKVDEAECGFVISCIKKAFRENEPALSAFWFGYAMGGSLSSQDEVTCLREWVIEKGGLEWWGEWLPFIRPKVGEQSWIDEPVRRISKHELDDIASVTNSRPASRMDIERHVSKSKLHGHSEGALDEHKETIKKYFRDGDVRGDGFISYLHLKQMFRALDPSWSDEQIHRLAQKMLSPDGNWVRYDDLVEHIFVG